MSSSQHTPEKIFELGMYDLKNLAKELGVDLGASAVLWKAARECLRFQRSVISLKDSPQWHR